MEHTHTLIVKKGKYGYFNACRTFPKCTYTEPILPDPSNIHICPVCSFQLIRNLHLNHYICKKCEYSINLNKYPNIFKWSL